MRVTIPHYYDFGEDRELVGDDLVRPEAWDALRTRTHGPFALPETHEEWEAVADDRDDIRLRAAALDAWLDDRGVRTLASYGVGGATLELWLHRLNPERALRLTDYTPATVERLRRLFPAAEIELHDLLGDAPLEADLHLFHRIDTEFDHAQFRRVLERFRGLSVLLVATEVIGLRRVLAELRRLPRNRRHATRAGLMRTSAAFEALWKPTHRGERFQLHDLEAWELQPRD